MLSGYCVDVVELDASGLGVRFLFDEILDGQTVCPHQSLTYRQSEVPTIWSN